MEQWEREEGLTDAKGTSGKSNAKQGSKAGKQPLVTTTKKTMSETKPRVASSRPSLLDRPLPKKTIDTVKKDGPAAWGSRKASARPSATLPTGPDTSAPSTSSPSFAKPKPQRPPKPNSYQSMIKPSVILASSQKLEPVTLTTSSSRSKIPPPPKSIPNQSAKSYQVITTQQPTSQKSRIQEDINLEGAQEDQLDEFEQALLADLQRLEESRIKASEDRFGPAPAYHPVVSTPESNREVQAKLQVASRVLEETAVAAYEGREPNHNLNHDMDHHHHPAPSNIATGSFAIASPSANAGEDPFYLEDFSLDEKVKRAVSNVEELAKRAYETHKRGSSTSSTPLLISRISSKAPALPAQPEDDLATSASDISSAGVASSAEFQPLQARTIKTQLQQLQHDSMKLQTQSRVIQEKAEAAQRRALGLPTPPLPPLPPSSAPKLSPLNLNPSQGSNSSQQHVAWEKPDSQKDDDSNKPLPGYLLAAQQANQAAKDVPPPGAEIDWKVPTLPVDNGSMGLPGYGSPIPSPGRLNYAAGGTGAIPRGALSASSSISSDWEPNVPRWAELVGISPAQSPSKDGRAYSQQAQAYSSAPPAPSTAPSLSKSPAPALHPLPEEDESPSHHTTIEVKPGSRHMWPPEQGGPKSVIPSILFATSPSSSGREFLPGIKIPTFDFAKYEARLTKIPVAPLDQPSIIPPQSLVQAPLASLSQTPLSSGYSSPASSSAPIAGKKGPLQQIGAGKKGSNLARAGLKSSLAPLVGPPQVKPGMKPNLPLPKAGGQSGLLPPIDPSLESSSMGRFKAKTAGAAVAKPVSGRKGVASARKSQSQATQAKKGVAFGGTSRSYQPNYLAKFG